MGEKCCWRWLAHSVLKEASSLKKDLDTVQEEREKSLNETVRHDLDFEAFAELRGAHTEKQRELSHLSTEVADLRREVGTMRTAHAYKAARAEELERELTRLLEARRCAAEREAAATRRADDAERELARAQAAEQELMQRLRGKEEMNAKSVTDQRELEAEYERLKLSGEEAEAVLKRERRRAKKLAAARRPLSAGRY